MNGDRSDWFAEVDAATTVADVATRLGLTVHRRRFGPCPVCGADDKRGPVGIPRPVVWVCKCGAKGSMAQLVRAVFPAMTWADVRGWFADAGWCSGEAGKAWTPPPPKPPPPPLPYPDEAELAAFRALWRPVGHDRIVAGFWRARGFGPRTGACRAIPERPAGGTEWPAWWRCGYARIWRLVAPMYTPDGVVRSVHARAVVDPGTYRGGDRDGEPRPKTHAPSGVRGDGLIFADPWIAAPMLRAGEMSGNILAGEGITDYAACTSVAVPDLAILGVISGSCAAFEHVRFAPGSVLYIGTHNDPVGDKYAAAIRANVGNRVECRRVVWGAGKDDASDIVKRGKSVRARLDAATPMP